MSFLEKFTIYSNMRSFDKSLLVSLHELFSILLLPTQISGKQREMRKIPQKYTLYPSYEFIGNEIYIGIYFSHNMRPNAGHGSRQTKLRVGYLTYLSRV